MTDLVQASINGTDIKSIKLCPHCQLPLVLFDITIQSDGQEIYNHNHCGKEILRKPGFLVKEKQACLRCKELCEHRTYRNGVIVINCDKCQTTSASGFAGGGRGGGCGSGSSGK